MMKQYLLLFLLACLAACSGDRPGTAMRSAHLRDAVPRVEPLSKRGNPDSYIQSGQRYFVLPTARGYRERGIASWYGRKFHGRETSNGERYNMYAMTAAHKTLPLPAYVRVTNLKNRRSVVLRVNDRGPFIDNRIIDLSYSAAEKLDMIRDGTALVEVVALEPGAGRTVSAVESRYKEAVDWRDESHLRNRIYVQVGAFSLRQNAEQLSTRLLRANIANVSVLQASQDAPLYRVRIGPLHNVASTDETVARLKGLGLADYRVVIE